MPDRSRAGVAAVLIATVAAACGSASDPTIAPASAEARGIAAAIVTDLCAARAASTTPDEAADAFARAHGPLHDFARELSERDRPLASEFLEAKQQVESALGDDSAGAALGARLDRLLEVTRRGLRAIGHQPDPCPDTTGTARP